MPKFQTILVPVDGSVNSERALSYAAYLALQCSASIGILHVVNLSSAVAAIGHVGTGGYIPDRVLDDIQEAGQSVIDEALKKIPPEVEAKGFLEIGSPKDIVVTFCAEKKYDLVIMGSRGLGTIEQLVLGSVSSYVLYHSNCPVMVVK